METEKNQEQYEVQRAGGAYAQGVPERVWRVVSTHATRAEADRACEGLQDEMHKRCGVGSWDDHFRVVPV